MTKTKLFIVDDNPVIRQGLRSLLEAEEQLDVSGEASTGAEAIQWMKKHSADVILMDIIMPTVNGLQLMPMIKDKIPGSAEQAHRLVGRLRKRYEGRGTASLLDGLKVDFRDHWIHVRPSNTEPIIRVIAEARTEAKARAAIDALKADIADLQGKL